MGNDRIKRLVPPGKRPGKAALRYFGPCLGTLLLAIVLPVGAAERHVPGQYATIQAAINSAVEGDSVVVAPGTYHEPLSIVGKNLSLLGAGAGVTVLSGANFGASGPPLLYLDLLDDRTLIKGFTFQDNQRLISPEYEGGAIQCDLDAGPTIQGNIFEENRAYSGAAISLFTFSASTAILDNIFLNNVAADGGAISLFYHFGARISNNYFEANEAVGHNTAIGRGGAIDTPYFPAIVETNVIVRNRAGNGGGLFIARGTVSQNSFALNEATVSGAGNLSIKGAPSDTTTVLRNIISYSAGGSGMHVEGVPLGPPVVLIDCNDFWGNEVGNLTVSNASASHGPNDTFADPLFCNPTMNNFALAYGSPCLAENNPACGQVGALGLGCSEVAGVDEPGRPAGSRFLNVVSRRGLGAEFEINMSGAADQSRGAQLDVFNLQGRLVFQVEVPIVNGNGRYSWSGASPGGVSVASGVYFARVTLSGLTDRERFILLR
jgi:hypothetical protein